MPAADVSEGGGFGEIDLGRDWTGFACRAGVGSTCANIDIFAV
jgi:hypothetical protein